MRIYLHTIDREAPFVLQHEELLRRTLEMTPDLALISDPGQADCVLAIPSFYCKFHWYSDVLRQDPIIANNYDRVLVFEACDAPVAHLPGLYVNMPNRRLRSGYVRSMPYLLPRSFPEGSSSSPNLLFSFRGALSHPIRRKIHGLMSNAPDGKVTILDRWMNYSSDETEVYLRELQDSAFVLCPRGIGTASIRLQETLEAGRVPVIISDDWAPPAGPDWDAISILCPETEVKGLADVLRARVGEADEMGALARKAWERFFCPGAPFGSWMVDKLVEIQAARVPGRTYADECARWEGAAFKWSSGYDLWHRSIRRANKAMSIDVRRGVTDRWS